MTETREVFGRPVTGDIQRTSREVVEQRDPKEFIDALDKLFEDDRVIAFRWDQYTPYFNDGEPCEFTIGDYGKAVKIVGLENYEGDYYNYGGFIELDEWYNYESGVGRVWHKEVDGVNTEGIFEAANDIPTDLSHSVWLRQTFGDHARVTATREGFDVEFYEHD